MSRRRGRDRRRQKQSAIPEPSRALVWDLPTRLSHWLIATLFVFLFVTGQYGLLSAELHLWAGYLLIVVLLFRLQWGLVGPAPARFSHFLTGPSALWRYLSGMWSREPSYWPGHNPLGGWSSALMLLLLAALATTGLFIETWAEVRGPFAERVTRETAIFMGDLHALLHWPLLALVGLHIVAALSYRVFKQEDRIGPMFISGRLRVPPGTADIEVVGKARVVLVLALSLAATALIVLLGPIN